MTNHQLQIKSFVFGPFETNCYVVSDEQQILLIDPACAYESEQQQLLNYIENQKSKIKNQKSPITNNQLPITIVATHGHLDHLWGAAWACAKWNTPVLMHEADIPMAKAMQQQYDLFGIRAKPQPFPIEDIKSKIKNHQSPITRSVLPTNGRSGLRREGLSTNHQLPMTNVSILSTPGHTPGSICLYFPKSPITNHQLPITNYQSSILLSGDTLFQMGYGRTDLPGGNYSQLMNSLDLLFALPSDVQVYPGHGELTTIAAERR